MKNLKINWPAIVAIALAMGIISYHNEKKVDEVRAQKAIDNITRIEQTIEEKKDYIIGTEVDEIIYPEEWLSEEKGFSK